MEVDSNFVWVVTTLHFVFVSRIGKENATLAVCHDKALIKRKTGLEDTEWNGEKSGRFVVAVVKPTLEICFPFPAPRVHGSFMNPRFENDLFSLISPSPSIFLRRHRRCRKKIFEFIFDTRWSSLPLQLPIAVRIRAKRWDVGMELRMKMIGVKWMTDRGGLTSSWDLSCCVESVNWSLRSWSSLALSGQITQEMRRITVSFGKTLFVPQFIKTSGRKLGRF